MILNDLINVIESNYCALPLITYTQFQYKFKVRTGKTIKVSQILIPQVCNVMRPRFFLKHYNIHANKYELSLEYTFSQMLR